ncbi:hypothetical protein TREMEDRAFT_63927 [Tremella mesenterica DSM 1558]|uniref:uncharacterized protein n=1 Tax=Tremella mesenterica (strain ATCC 24925 / CBS 8224 / DSM 1558 / NBRC 9311 / NRRL Y-6157 / RJB 2259-6 / UBC 559-6) TaxID=578456 RepID=UPI0003F49C24|nr:uncharacterized protein TREMEDRAFT_63927 [Tremella mesenterica DSM 1558]EIW68041.1 hypothetical protein TREMEDRAFT_63927 [Tremella mesenterica DSM 1558]
MSKSTKTPSSTQDLKWDQYYNDPSANIIFVSSDNVHFRVHGWNLKRHSQVFADMLTLPSPPPQTHAHSPEFHAVDNALSLQHSPLPITIDAPADTLRHFMNCCHSSMPTLDITTAELSAVLALCDKYDCGNLKNKIMDAYETIAHRDPKQTFVIASRYNHIKMARAAIKHFPVNAGLTSLGKAVTDIRSPWLVELCCRRFGGSIEGGRCYVDNWESVARGFDP